MASTPELEHSLVTELNVDAADPEVARARAAIASRLLGAPPVQPKIGRFVVLERLGAGGMGIVYAAFDPHLDRKVALKLLFRRDTGSEDRARMIREAQTMAKLAHPNVVHVYEVGEHAGRTFVAMELVRGTTLTAWLGAARRSVREVVDACAQAGRGLAAAHREGIVHRDFKPDNILIGDDGRARVVDFGLARVVDQLATDDAAPASMSAGTSPTRRSGSIAGTPGYVAPELLAGARASASSDQFSFCVTMWEALSGSVPVVTGDALPTIPPTIPQWIARILLRGLGEHTRHAHMDDLLRELDKDPARTRAKWIWGGVATFGLAAAFAIGAQVQSTSTDRSSCDGATQILEQAWPVAEREAAFTAVASTGPYGEVAATHLRTLLDAYADDWAAAHRDACVEHRQGHLSVDRFDRIGACLDRGRAAYALFGRMLPEVQGGAVPGFVVAASVLQAPNACAETDEQKLSADAEAMRLPLLEAGFFVRAYQLDDALAKVRQVVSTARAQQQPVVLAEALMMEGVVLIDMDDWTTAAERLREAELVALRADAPEIAIEAWGQHAYIVGKENGKALEGRDLILAMAEARPTSFATLSLYNNLGGAALGEGDRETGRAMYERAYELAPAVPGRRARLLEYTLMGALAEHVEDEDVRDRLARDSVAGLEQMLGAHHPRTLVVRMILGNLIESPEAAVTEHASLCTDLRRYHPHNASYSSCVEQWALAAELAGDAASSRTARAQWQSTAAGIDASLANAETALARGDLQATVSFANEVIAGIPAEHGWWEDVTWGRAEVLLGRARQSMGERDADAMMERGLQRMRGEAGRHTPGSVSRQIAFAEGVRAGTLPLPVGEGT